MGLIDDLRGVGGMGANMRLQAGNTEARVLLALVRSRRPWAPTMREIAADASLSNQAVHRGLHALRERGLVSFQDGQARTLVPLAKEVSWRSSTT